MAKKKRICKRHNPDAIMKNLWFALLSDFRSTLNSPNLWKRQADDLKQCVRLFRKTEWPGKITDHVYLYKAQYQLENLFKRYTFEHDLFDSKERNKAAIDDFIEYQQQLCRPPCNSLITYKVMQGARRIIKRVLGNFPEEEFLEKVSFGRRANNQVPYLMSYLDVKAHTLSGTREQHNWFEKTYLPLDPIMHDIMKHRDLRVDTLLAEAQLGPPHVIVRTLDVVGVPKKFDTDRTISPNTVIGAFHSNGVARLIEERLVAEGLDIRYLQHRQRNLAKLASVHRKWVTGDLSKASDSFTFWHINKLVPRSWVPHLKLGVTRHVKVGDQVIPLQSFMPMGIGFTFALETLFFYAILKSISELSNVRGLISVYGDDIIYPRKMHRYVEAIFPRLGLKLNRSKTSVETHFRESCGGDYCHGKDVRPYQPEYGGGDMVPRVYEVFLYKILNGLLRRWDRCEVSQAVHLLETEIATVSGQVLLVPPSFPDGAGFKVDDTRSLSKRWFVPYVFPKWNIERQCYSFKYIGQTSNKRLVTFVYPYYWDALRTSNLTEEEWNPFRDATDNTNLQWVKHPCKHKRKYFRARVSRKRLCKLLPAVTQKNSLRNLLQTGFDS